MRIAFFVLLGVLLVLVVSARPCWSDSDIPTVADRSPHKLDKIVVTGSALPKPLRTIPRNVTVIDSEDIARSAATTVPDLLAQFPGLQLFNNTGVEGRGLIDIRGQGGATATNVLVLVDGMRLNSVDMSGPNLGGLSLAQIERIEILRGPGSVLYGNNAVGGVINIITKSARDKPPSLNAALTHGSFNTTTGWADFAVSREFFSLSATAQVADSDGYRDNGHLRRRDGQVRFGFAPHPDLDLDMILAVHKQAYGLPGGVPLADIYDRDARRRTSRPDNHGKRTDFRIQSALTYDLHTLGAVRAAVGLRDRDSSFTFVNWMDGQIQETAGDWHLAWNKHLDVGGLRQQLVIGTDGFRSDYAFARTSLFGDRMTRGIVTSTGLYATLGLSLTEALGVILGGRAMRHDIDHEVGDDVLWDKTVFDVGATHDLGFWGRVYASLATGFRTPTIDEMGLAVPDIKPQISRNYELGVALTPGEALEVNAAVYHLRTKDEIYFDPVRFRNANYAEVTIRNGLELGAAYRIMERLTLRGGYAWTRARFEDTKATVPLVAEHQFSLGADWQALEPLLLSIIARHSSSKHDGNDMCNTRFAKIAPYTVVDMKGAWTVSDRFTLTLAASNVFDELYSTAAYSERYFVMPGRAVLAGIEVRF